MSYLADADDLSAKAMLISSLKFIEIAKLCEIQTTNSFYGYTALPLGTGLFDISSSCIHKALVIGEY